MRVAEVCPYDMAMPGGVQGHIRDLAAALEEAGHPTRIIAPRLGPGDLGFAAGHMRRVAIGGTAYEVAWANRHERRRLAAYLATENFDLIHYHTPWSPILGLQLLGLSQTTNVATFHDTPPEGLIGRLTRIGFRLASRLLIPRFDAVTAVSDSPASHLARVPGRPIHVLPPCTDFARFQQPAEPFTEYRDGRLNLLFLGRLEPRKGLLHLLEAYRQLLAQHPSLRLIVVGEGRQRAKAEHLIASHRLSEVVLVGAVSEEDKRRWYATADIFCAPAPYGESFGIVLVEAMASGLPVVAAANRGYRTVLNGEAAELLTPPGDAGALAAAIGRLIDDPALRTRLANWGRREALRHDCRTHLPEFIAVFEEALARHSL